MEGPKQNLQQSKSCLSSETSFAVRRLRPALHKVEQLKKGVPGSALDQVSTPVKELRSKALQGATEEILIIAGGGHCGDHQQEGGGGMDELLGSW